MILRSNAPKLSAAQREMLSRFDDAGILFLDSYSTAVGALARKGLARLIGRHGHYGRKYELTPAGRSERAKKPRADASYGTGPQDCKCAGPGYSPDTPCPIHPKVSRS